MVAGIITQGLGSPPPYFVLQGYWSSLYENSILSPTQAFLSGSPSVAVILGVTPTIAAVSPAPNLLSIPSSRNSATIADPSNGI